jgi:hypothetical protein
MSGPKYNEEKQKKEEEYWCVEGKQYPILKGLS